MSTNSESRPDPGRRRSALKVGLETVLTAMQVKAALRLWDDQYAATRSMALAEYVVDLSQRLDYTMQERHALRVAIYHAISMYDVRQGAARAAPTPAKLAPPVAPTPPAAAAPPAPKPALPAAYVVFEAMADYLLASARREGTSAASEFSSALDRHSQSLRMNSEQVVAIRRWLRGEGALEAVAREPDARLGLLIHAMYAATAEAIGPTAADRALARAAQAAEELPEAQRFSPRRLL